jgi:hypothetical protein
MKKGKADIYQTKKIEMARLVGIHVSPTVVFNGVVANEISSSWTSEQWSEWLKKNVV